jgi:hypothetical protein
MRRGRIEFDGPTEPAIARHHELLTLDASNDTGSSLAGAGTVTVLERELLGPSGPTTTMDQHTPVRFRARLRFDADVESPQVWFQVLAQDGTLAYEMKTAIGQSYRVYEAGDEAEVDIAFMPRLGGGSYRLALSVTSLDGRSTLHADHEGVLVYLAPPLGSAGIADLEATIAVDGRCLTEHESLLLGQAEGSGPPGDLAGGLGA